MNKGIRVNLTLPPEVDHVLARISKATGVGKATFVGQYLAEALPQLDQLALVMEQAAAGNIDAFTTMIKAVRQATGEVEQIQLGLKNARRAVMRKRVKKSA
jgi:hypothetical protein